MKILAIRGENITSLEKFDVNFQVEPLKSAGIFSIIGPTGAGKSSILDTMCLALFNKVPRLDEAGKEGLKFDTSFGEIGQDNIVHMIRRGQLTCKAEVEFLGVDGNEYRTTWGYRLPLKGKSGPLVEYSLVRLSDLQVVKESTVTKHYQKLEMLVGLKYEEFIRTVFLSQGKFAEFLKSDDNTRSALLEKITGTGIYTQISMKIFERNKSETQLLESYNEKIRNLQLLSPEKITELTSEVNTLQASIINQESLREMMKKAVLAIVKWKNNSDDLTLINIKEEQNKVDEVNIKSVFEKSCEDLSAAEGKLKEMEPVFKIVSDLDTALAVLKQRESDAIIACQSSKNGYEALIKRNEESDKLEKAENVKLEICKKWLQAQSKYELLSGEWGRWETVLNDCKKSIDVQASINNSAEIYKQDLVKFTKIVSEFEADKVAKLLLLGDVDRNDLTKNITKLNEQIAEIKNCQDYLRIKRSYFNSIDLLNNLKAKKQVAGLELVPAQRASDVAREMYDLTIKATGENIETLRAALVKGESCSVCGSVDHPYAGGDDKLNILLKEQKIVRDQRQKELNEIMSTIKAFDAQIIEANNNFVLAEKQFKDQLEPTTDIYKKIVNIDIDQQDKIIIKESKIIKDDLTDYNAKNEISQNIQKIETHLLSFISDKRSCSEKLTSIEISLRSELERHEGHLAQLDTVFGDQSWRTNWTQNPEEFLRKMEEIVKEYKKQLTNVSSSEVVITRASDLLKELAISIPLAQKKALDEKAKLDEIVSSKKEQNEKREEIFGIEKVDAAREREQVLIKTARDKKDLDKIVMDDFVKARTYLSGEKSVKVKEAILLSEEISSCIPLISQNKLCELIYDWSLVDESKYVVIKNLIELHLPELEGKLQKAINGKAEITSMLKQNDAAQLNSVEIMKMIFSQKQIQEKWSKLSSEIGSADGKLFRRIAQVYTLEILLSHANAQLKQITTRYDLQQAGDSVHFGVIDHENFDDLRPIHTLSGGETFVVSLALALGLSSMTSKGLAIESLFIDEGFGTLDTETLNSVMNALSQLQAQGRKVGLITHVEDMKEQIPTSIVVKKEGMGVSSVSVVG